MTDTAEEEVVSGLSQYTHMDPEKHLIGESLPVPSASIAGSLTAIGSAGVSPIAAREDHIHPANATMLAVANWGVYQEFTTAIGGAGWAVGNGSLNGRYTLINKMCHFRMQFISGSTSTYGASQLTITPPFPASAGYRQFIDGWVLGATVNRIIGMIVGASVFSLYSHTSATAALGSLVQNAPITWVAGNSLAVSGVYEIA